MKKLLLLCCLLPLAVMAQVGPIQTQEKPYEFIYENYLYRMVATDEYVLQIVSDNQFENKVVKLTLGHGAQEAITSLSSLFAAVNGADSDFSLQGYNFAVRSKRLYAYNNGILKYTAGNYTIRKPHLANAMYELIRQKDLPIGEVHILRAAYSSVYVQYVTYAFETIVDYSNVTLSFSKNYMDREIISSLKDIRMLKAAAENPNNYRTDKKKGANVLQKEQIIRICDFILQAEVFE